jgi:DNA-binding transcriptional MerR regulator
MGTSTETKSEAKVIMEIINECQNKDVDIDEVMKYLKQNGFDIELGGIRRTSDETLRSENHKLRKRITELESKLNEKPFETKDELPELIKNLKEGRDFKLEDDEEGNAEFYLYNDSIASLQSAARFLISSMDEETESSEYNEVALQGVLEKSDGLKVIADTMMKEADRLLQMMNLLNYHFNDLELVK